MQPYRPIICKINIKRRPNDLHFPDQYSIVRNMSNYKTKDAQALAESFKALSNKNRLQIFMRLLSCCEPGTVCSSKSPNGFSVGELGENLSVAPSTLSHHIKELHRAGLITTQRRGQNVECFVNTEKVAILKKLFSGDMLIPTEK